MDRKIRSLEWADGKLGSTVECGWLSGWVEPLLGEGVGRFCWSVDTPDTSNPEVFVNLKGGVESGLNAAKLAVTEAMEFLKPAGSSPAAAIQPLRIRCRRTSRER